MKISINFLEQEHIAELTKCGQLANYQKLLLSLEQSNFSYTHARKGLTKDLSKYSGIAESDLRQIILVLIKYGVFVYKYKKVAYFNEKHLFYDNGKCAYDKKISKEQDIKEKTWAELIAEV